MVHLEVCFHTVEPTVAQRNADIVADSCSEAPDEGAFVSLMCLQGPGRGWAALVGLFSSGTSVYRSQSQIQC